MKYSLVLQSFGREQEYRRAVFCLMSLFCYAKLEWIERVIIFTDNREYFEPYLPGIPVQYILLTHQKVKAMRGGIDFLHRMKIAMIDEAFQITSGNILYVDSDTFFLSSPEPVMSEVSPSVSFMHLPEYEFSALKEMPLPAGIPFRAFYELIVAQEFVLASGLKFKISPQFSSWNAGTMALHQSHQTLLKDVYKLTDQFYPATNNHASEQYAFSIVLQNQTRIKALNSIIYHYWYRVKKNIMDELLNKEFNSIFLSMNADQRMRRISTLTKRLPHLLENHILTLRDNAIQAFHENKFSTGYLFTLRALLKNPFDVKFLKDIVYHTKRYFSHV